MLNDSLAVREPIRGVQEEMMLDRPNLREWHRPHIVRPTYALEELQTVPEWRAKALEQITKLTALPQNWDSYGALPVSEGIGNIALQLLDLLMRANTPSPSIVPTPGGHLQLEWHTKGIDLEIEIHSSLLLRVSFEDRSGEEWDKDLSSDLSDLTKAITVLSNR